MNKTMELKLWDVDADTIKELLTEFIENWKISKNTDLHEFLISAPKYFSADDQTKEAIEIILNYGKNLMEDPNAEVDFFQNKIWELPSGGTVRLRHCDDRQIANSLNEIVAQR